ncbi:hypothetical protein ABTK87_19760, partial [Acinetobacter baumannii]
VEQSTAAAHSLSGEAQELARVIAGFRVDGEAAAAPVRSVRAAPTRAAAPTAALKTYAPRGGGAARKPVPAAQSDSWEEF